MFVASPGHNTPRLTPPRPSGRWGTLGMALGAGLAAALLAFLLVRGQTVAARPPLRVPVVVAAQDLPARTRLTPNMLQVRRVPSPEAPDGSLGSLVDLVGRVLVRPVAAGKAVVISAVAAPGASLGMAFTLPRSQRAVTVALDPADGVDEFARPGDHVDILATDEPGSQPAETRTVLQNVPLLAVGSQTSADADAPASSPSGGPAASHVTVAVSPAQAQALVLAAARGKIHLALRAADDTNLVGLPAFPAPVVPPESARSAPPHPKLWPRRVAEKAARPAPSLPPLSPLPPLPVTMPAPARVTITVIKGSQSQTVSVTP